MKSWSDVGDHGVEVLPLNAAPSRTRWRSGIFHSLTPFVRHWPKTSSTCVSSMTPGHVAAPLVHDLDERRQDRARTRSRAMRSAPVAAPCRCASRLDARAPLRARGRTTAAPVPCRPPPDAGRPRPVALHLAALPELLEIERVRVGDLTRVERHDDVLLAGPRVIRPVRRSGPAPPRRRARRTCGA